MRIQVAGQRVLALQINFNLCQIMLNITNQLANIQQLFMHSYLLTKIQESRFKQFLASLNILYITKSQINKQKYQTKTVIKKFRIVVVSPMSTNRLSVYLNLYDFTPANCCLDIFGLGGYHTGIEVMNNQICYFVCDTDFAKTGVTFIDPETADFAFNRKIFLGESQLNTQQIDIMIEQLSRKYTCGDYHLFDNNCNHFSDELARQLTGNGIPKWIFNATNILSCLCCCLPTGLVSGQWALQMLEQEIKKEVQKAKTKRKNSESTEF